eukprot:gene13924-biopygen10007
MNSQAAWTERLGRRTDGDRFLVAHGGRRCSVQGRSSSVRPWTEDGAALGRTEPLRPSLDGGRSRSVLGRSALSLDGALRPLELLPAGVPWTELPSGSVLPNPAPSFRIQLRPPSKDGRSGIVRRHAPSSLDRGRTEPDSWWRTEDGAAPSKDGAAPSKDGRSGSVQRTGPDSGRHRGRELGPRHGSLTNIKSPGPEA